MATAQILWPERYDNLDDATGLPFTTVVTCLVKSIHKPRRLKWNIEFECHQINDSYRTAESIVKIENVSAPLFHEHKKEFGSANLSGSGQFHVPPFSSFFITAKCTNENAESKPGHPRIVITIEDV